MTADPHGGRHPRPGRDNSGRPDPETVRRRSAVLLLWLHQAPRWVLPLVSGGLLVAGLTLTGVVGAALLTLLAAFLAWLAALSWPALGPRQRAMRLGPVVILAGLAVLQTGLI